MSVSTSCLLKNAEEFRKTATSLEELAKVLESCGYDQLPPPELSRDVPTSTDECEEDLS